MEKSLITHDRLQSCCYQHLHNTYPHLRKTFWAVTIPPKHAKETPGEYAMRLSRLKAIGQVNGVYDMMLFYKNCLFCFDFKIGKDTLSEDQIEFSFAIEKQGGKCYEINSLDQFKKVIISIII